MKFWIKDRWYWVNVDDYIPVRVDYDEAQWGGLQRSDLDLKPDAGCFLDGSCEHHEWAFYAIAASQLLNDRFAGPNFTPVHCVELYVSREHLHAPLQEPENENPLCEHGTQSPPSTENEGFATRSFEASQPGGGCAATSVTSHGRRRVSSSSSFSDSLSVRRLTGIPVHAATTDATSSVSTDSLIQPPSLCSTASLPSKAASARRAAPTTRPKACAACRPALRGAPSPSSCEFLEQDGQHDGRGEEPALFNDGFPHDRIYAPLL